MPVGVGEGEGVGVGAVPVVLTAKPALSPFASRKEISAVPAVTAVTVNTALGALVLARRRSPLAWSDDGDTVATAVFDDDAVKTPV
ncbi:MAG: hypothetical protein JO225_11465 [Candidatus Eremiobacteraeota bacterium]|nr:hypothetical protein [Candidatus Eremiobacteraeota bacterium]